MEKMILLLSGPMKDGKLNNQIIKAIKKEISSIKLCVFIPTTFDNYEKNDIYVKGNDQYKGMYNIFNEIFEIKDYKIIV